MSHVAIPIETAVKVEIRFANLSADFPCLRPDGHEVLVGFFLPDGRFLVCDWSHTAGRAWDMVHYLNGGSKV